MNILSTLLGFWYFWGIYRAKRRSGGHPGPIAFLLAHKKSSWSFVAFGLRLVLIFCDVKNMEKTATGTWHYVNRFVPKNDIK